VQGNCYVAIAFLPLILRRSLSCREIKVKVKVETDFWIHRFVHNGYYLPTYPSHALICLPLSARRLRSSPPPVRESTSNLTCGYPDPENGPALWCTHRSCKLKHRALICKKGERERNKGSNEVSFLTYSPMNRLLSFAMWPLSFASPDRWMRSLPSRPRAPLMR
jgi:hypothetical protein